MICSAKCGELPHHVEEAFLRDARQPHVGERRSRWPRAAQVDQRHLAEHAAGPSTLEALAR